MLGRKKYGWPLTLVQGFIPPLITHEIIIRKNVINDVMWRAFLDPQGYIW